MNELRKAILDRIVDELYDQPIMSNLSRPHYVERMIASQLAPEWCLVSQNWAGWDIENSKGVRGEIKQSAARQTWTDDPNQGGRVTKGVFDIKPRTGYWADDGARWIPFEGRLADFYIFAWHPIADSEFADHRDPDQWLFYVVPECSLPPGQKTISQTVIAQQWPEVQFPELATTVSAAVATLPFQKWEQDGALRT